MTGLTTDRPGQLRGDAADAEAADERQAARFAPRIERIHPARLRRGALGHEVAMNLKKRASLSALLSGLLNVLLIAAASVAPSDGNTIIQAVVRAFGLPAGILVHAVGAEGHGGMQAVLLIVFSFVFYWLAIWAVLYAAAKRHGAIPLERGPRSERASEDHDTSR